jgi:hypothetical protein
MIEDIDPEAPATSRLHHQRHLESLKTFMESIAYQGYLSARRMEIEQVKSNILLNEPSNPQSIAEDFKMRGELKTLEEMLNVFKDARLTLERRIEEMLERENQKTETIENE